VDPYGLVLAAGTWYLVAMPVEGGSAEPAAGPAGAATTGPRTYRVSRVHEAIELDEPARRPPDLDLERLWWELRRDFASAGHAMLDVHVRVRPPMLATFERLQARAIVAIEPADPNAEWRTVRLRYAAPEAARGALLGFGDSLEVVEPARVRIEMARAATAVVALYDREAAPDRAPAGLDAAAVRAQRRGRDVTRARRRAIGQ
jgi:predicted DNA-binding transcriptional regulator YafY